MGIYSCWKSIRINDVSNSWIDLLQSCEYTRVNEITKDLQDGKHKRSCLNMKTVNFF